MNTSRICYKLTDSEMQTYGGTQWVMGKTKRTSGAGELCGPGWLHWYDDPIVALMMNPTHAGFVTPRLFVAKWGGKRKDDRGCKSGSTALTLAQEVLPVPAVTITQRVAFGILAALEVTQDSSWRKWAERWLSDEGRFVAAPLVAVPRPAVLANSAAGYAGGRNTNAAAIYGAYAVSNAAIVRRLDLPMIAAWAMALGGDV